MTKKYTAQPYRYHSSEDPTVYTVGWVYENGITINDDGMVFADELSFTESLPYVSMTRTSLPACYLVYIALSFADPWEDTAEDILHNATFHSELTRARTYELLGLDLPPLDRQG